MSTAAGDGFVRLADLALGAWLRCGRLGRRGGAFGWRGGRGCQAHAAQRASVLIHLLHLLINGAARVPACRHAARRAAGGRAVLQFS